MSRCAMRGSCGRKGMFGKELPCPYDGSPQEPEETSRSRLIEVCGSEFAQGPTCCTSGQLETLAENFQQVDLLISSCPACKNNFRSFFCAFTCSPDQGSFVNVTSTQKSSTNEQAVKSVDFHVGQQFGEGFFDSCKYVQVGAANSYAMDFIGGGAKNYTSFFKFLGDEKPIGSPFQINFPLSADPDITPLDPKPRSCSDSDLSSRCACVDCPSICPVLPEVPPPTSQSTCSIGPLSCLTFGLIITYSIILAGFLITVIVDTALKKRREHRYERVRLSSDTSSLSSRPPNRGLVGAASLARNPDEDAIGILSESRRLGQGAALLDPIETVQPRQHHLNNLIRRAFYRLGLFAASSPSLTFAVVFLIFGLLNVGWKKFEVETDPVRLWVSPASESKQQKEFFDQHFGPFYRTEQIFIRSIPDDSSNSTLPPVLSWNHLQDWAKVESHIRDLSSPTGYTLDDVCFKPAGPEGACVVQSVMAWFGNDLDYYDEDTWLPHLEDCAYTPSECLPDYMQPLGPQYVLGGVPVDDDGRKRYSAAEALVVTYVVQDSLDPELQAKAMEWEKTLREYLIDVAGSIEDSGLQISFSTGVSLEEEINKSTNTDVKIVILSYLAMFVYVSLTLGNGAAGLEEETVGSALRRWARNFPRLFSKGSLTSSSLSVDSRSVPTILPRLPRSLFTTSKVTLGLFGISLVILSVCSSVGLFSLLGVKVTLIIAEVIPFLVLAVGVDNVFILVHELDRQNLLHGPNAAPNSQAGLASPVNSHRSRLTSSHDDVDAVSMPLLLSAEERIARTLAKMGPSILLSSITETVAFALGALVPMPAVRNFALYAAGSVLLNAILQVTVFISALYWDLKRAEASRMDLFPCIRLPSRIALVDVPTSNSLSTLARFIRRTYAPFLLKPTVKPIIGLIFTGIFFASIISMQHINLGLDQRLALPSDSYLIPYFDALDAYLDVGPPVYFVSVGVNVTQRPGQQALCGRFTTCQEFSMASVLEAERQRPEVSFISEPTASWIDDFLGWLDPSKESCCRVRKSNPSVFCGPRDSPRLCQPCYLGKEPAWNITMDGFPENEEFMRYVNQWLISPTDEECPLAGKASFGSAISFTDGDGSQILASHFRTFHSPLKSQEDFINSFAAARRVADEISEATGTTVFPYSLHYVFFDQYAHIVSITQEVLGLGLASVLIVNALLLGSWRTASIVTTVVALTVVSVMGVMAVWGIDLNAISLVNLVISLGISVEFCAHVARAFMSAGSGLPVDHPGGQKERDERMWSALVDVGPSVLSGITFTKLIGMSVLGLTRSKLLEIYYFRMWLILILSGALHGLVLLPVILSVAGGPGYPQQEDDEAWMSNAIRNDYEYAPFLPDDESVASD